jgi:hypothetical protein
MGIAALEVMQANRKEACAWAQDEAAVSRN